MFVPRHSTTALHSLELDRKLTLFRLLLYVLVNPHKIFASIYDSQLKNTCFFFFQFSFPFHSFVSVFYCCLSFTFWIPFFPFLSCRHWCSLHWPSERWASPQLKTKSIGLSASAISLTYLLILLNWCFPWNFHQLIYFDLVTTCSNVIQTEFS